MMYSKRDEFPIGSITVFATDSAVVRITMREEPSGTANDIAEKAIEQLHEYFNGKRRDFDFPICYLRGTTFQQAVWNALQTVSYGETVSYGDIAKAIGRPSALRAVGTAVGKNPLFIVNPCHRVVRSDGALGGFAYGVTIKKQLLQIEKQHKERF